MEQPHPIHRTFRQRVLAGEPVFGTFGFLSDPAVIEILGLAGMDYVIIDLEHAPKDWQTVENMVRAAELRGIAPLIRVHENREKDILQALETGAEGIVVPFIESAEDARQAGLAVRFPPDGTRGTCTLSRSAFYSARRGAFLEHTQQSNKEILLIGLIESQKGIDDIAAIVAAEPGPDVFLVGRGDLATALGTPGKTDSEPVIAATDAIFGAVAANPARHIAMGVYDPGEVAPWYDRGCRIFFYASDTAMLYQAVRGLNDAFRETVREHGVLPAGRRTGVRL